MVSFLNWLAVAAAVVGVLAIVVFFIGPGNEAGPGDVLKDMTLTQIHHEIEEISERRVELWHILSEGHNPTAAAELKSLSERLDHLWDEERTLKAALRFGDREHIVARARVEERLERAA